MLAGEPFIFELCGEIEEWLRTNNLAPNASLFDKIEFEKRKAEEEKERQKILSEHVVGVDAHSVQDYDKSHTIDGTVVTEELFHEWNTNFIREYREVKALNSTVDESKLGMLTGKEIFELAVREKMNLPQVEEENLMVFDESVF